MSNCQMAHWQPHIVLTQVPCWGWHARGPAFGLAQTPTPRLNCPIAGINTNLPNSLVSEALARNQLIPLAGYRSIRREVGYGNNSRIDFLLQHPQRAPCYVEVKNVHLKRGMRAEFPDCPTARGAKHLSEMMAMRAQGARCVMLYIVQRADVNAFSIAHDLDKNYAHLFTQALAQGVEAYAYSCEISVERVVLAHPLPLML
jgi:sugar fermentation stimulation protein A